MFQKGGPGGGGGRDCSKFQDSNRSYWFLRQSNYNWLLTTSHFCRSYPADCNKQLRVCLSFYFSLFLSYFSIVYYFSFLFLLIILPSVPRHQRVSQKPTFYCLSVFLPHSLPPPPPPLVYMYAHKRNVIMMFLHICRNCETALINCIIVLIIFVCKDWLSERFSLT